jgi:hypothetical protein
MLTDERCHGDICAMTRVKMERVKREDEEIERERERGVQKRR